MKTKPILFSAQMVRALLDGSKTQTRRVVKPQPPDYVKDLCSYHHPQPGHWLYGWSKENAELLDWCIKSPYGGPGDMLWVRETFSPIYPQDPAYNGGRPIEYDYAATYTHGDRLGDLLGMKKVWKPSIHMPRAASRITLEITGVRVERLQAISEADAIAEGCSKNHNGYYWGGPHPEHGLKQMATATGAYRDLWGSINGPGSWESNPWVWVVEFKRV
jgi:hypothetical protein